MGFPGGSAVKNPATNAGAPGDAGLDPWVGKIPRRRKWHPTPRFSPGESHGQRSLVGCGPRGRKEPDMTEHMHTHSWAAPLGPPLYPGWNQRPCISSNFPGDIYAAGLRTAVSSETGRVTMRCLGRRELDAHQPGEPVMHSGCFQTAHSHHDRVKTRPAPITSYSFAIPLLLHQVGTSA